MFKKVLGNYKCICGKEFNNSQSFNGHKSNCKQHLLSKGWTEEQLQERKEKTLVPFKNKNKREHDKSEQKKQLESKQWLSEQHTCEKCGKVMIEKFGSGRFCSQSCANSHIQTNEIKEKISQSVRKYNKSIGKISKPKTFRCVVCGKQFNYVKGKFRTTCSDECLHKLRVKRTSDSIKQNGYHKTIYSQYKFGTYKGFECDSSWELAFLIYCLDHNLDIKRNRNGFNYIYKGSSRTFFPDFIVSDTYYEIKGVWTDQVTAKVNQFPKDKKLTIIDRKCMKKYIDYCKNTYGKNFAEILYDVDKPNWTQSDKYKHFIEKDYHRKSISDVCY